MNDEWERILNEGIASYAKVEPLAGLEERVLRKVATAERRRWSFVWWLLPIAAALAGLVVLWPAPKHEPYAIGDPAVRTARVDAPSAPTEIPRKKHRATARAVRRRETSPVFPTPSPLTAEERALVALAAQSPETLQQMAETSRKMSEPIHIEELTIKPLGDGGGQ